MVWLRGYKAGISKFIQFCQLYSITHPLPASQSTLCAFITYLAHFNMTYATIRTYRSAIRHLHISWGLPEPAPKLDLVARGIHRTKGAESSGRVRPPITPTILCQLRALWTWRAHELDITMLWAAALFCFFALFRIGEIKHHRTVASTRVYTWRSRM